MSSIQLRKMSELEEPCGRNSGMNVRVVDDGCGCVLCGAEGLAVERGEEGAGDATVRGGAECVVVYDELGLLASSSSISMGRP